MKALVYHGPGNVHSAHWDHYGGIHHLGGIGEEGFLQERESVRDSIGPNLYR